MLLWQKLDDHQSVLNSFVSLIFSTKICVFFYFYYLNKWFGFLIFLTTPIIKLSFKGTIHGFFIYVCDLKNLFVTF